MDNTLEMKNVEVFFKTPERNVRILRGINLAVGKNESVALAGESGSGKSMTALSAIRLLPKNLYVSGGEITLRGQNVLALPERELRRMRGTAAGMIFQEPSSYLNPLFTVGSQVAEAIKDRGADKKERVLEMLAEVELKSSVYYLYPHQLSGGMQQRVMIAMALINSPAILIADEPTTALDATTAYGIIEILKRMMSRYGLSVLFITHDISLAASFAGRIGVMYAGRIVEMSAAGNIEKNPLHPYTEKLMACLPERYQQGEKIKTIEGAVPDFKDLPSGCPFHPRCPYRQDICMEKEPGETVKGESIVRCYRYGKISKNG